ncbi:hypothetical protein SEVIR_5G417600v4 [Setaria viridis]|uniref:peptidylprolyl isomerase n=2 Tax=Setaria TaxID=4554 RepID=K3XLM0_SETIT|nr:uncharacterized protein LOC101760034 isoform X2 [Setaria italica]XP_034593170.1 uncharacterized protein LOC117855005 isoform X4 [Setaria viridis]RCV28534.1 hypothetical protein SETIT_5G412100v2 [Setaria italica]TKW18213.1 hypothetical protein SEVIR_5G417600v2 [Setaria viridis]
MASAATLPKFQSRPRCRSYFQVIDQVRAHIRICGASKCRIPAQGFLRSGSGVGTSLRHTFQPVSAVGSGRDSSITEADRKSDLSLENVKTSVASRDGDKINVRVQLPGKATQKVFDEALTILSRDAPPVPGFRKSKGGKTSNIPSSILLQMLGKSRVTKFVLQEILSITIEEFVKKENIKVNPEIKTTQTESEMESAFTPGSAFGFNVILQLEKSDSDEDSEEQSDSSE